MTKEEIVALLRETYAYFLGRGYDKESDLLLSILETIGADHDLPM